MIMRIEYDPIRNTKIALICYKNGIISYILNIEGLNVGDQIINFNFLMKTEEIQLSLKYNKGYSLYLKNIPSGFLINNIELIPGFGSCFCRSAGSFAIVLNRYFIRNKTYVLIRLPSGVEYLLLDQCRAVLGIVSNINYYLNS
jgi:large subunit ribosomal protein L2